MELRHPAEILFQEACNRSVFAGISTAYVIKQLVHAFSCAHIELWMHLGSLESTQETRFLSRALQTSQVHPYLDVRTLQHEPIVN